LVVDDAIEEFAAQLARGVRLSAGDDALVPVFMRKEARSIPGIGRVVDVALRPFDLAVETPGHFAFLRFSPEASTVKRAVTVMTTCITLVLPHGIAYAQPAAQDPAAAKAPALPAEKPAEAADPAAHGTEATTTAPTVEGPAAQTQAPATETANLYTALVGSDLQLSMRDGGTFRGRLISVQGEWLIAARIEDGRVVAVMQDQVAQVQVASDRGPGKPRRIPDTGAGRIGAGAAMIGGGAVMVIGGIFGAVYYTDYYGDAEAYVWAPLIVPAIVMLGVGIPLFIRGNQIHKQFKKDFPEYRVKISPRREVAWDGGLRLRF
jgi:hypothetical protein